jgi:hypothetical protein
MMLAVFLVALLVSLSLAYAGLVKKSLKVSASRTITGRNAAIVGACCLAFALLLVGSVILLLLQIE